jgi:hypothetical protein
MRWKQNDCVTATLAGFVDDIVLQLGHGNDSAGPFIFNDAEHFETAWWVAVSPNVHAIHDFSCAAAPFGN